MFPVLADRSNTAPGSQDRTTTPAARDTDSAAWIATDSPTLSIVSRPTTRPACFTGPVPAGGKLGHNALNWSVSLMLIALLLLALYGGYLWHLWPTT